MLHKSTQTISSDPLLDSLRILENKDVLKDNKQLGQLHALVAQQALKNDMSTDYVLALLKKLVGGKNKKGDYAGGNGFDLREARLIADTIDQKIG